MNTIFKSVIFPFLKRNGDFKVFFQHTILHNNLLDTYFLPFLKKDNSHLPEPQTPLKNSKLLSSEVIKTHR